MSFIFNKLRIILTNEFCFHYNQLQKETKFELELGMDSREMLELFTAVEVAFKININLDEIDRLIERGKLITIQDLVNYIEKKEGSGS